MNRKASKRFVSQRAQGGAGFDVEFGAVPGAGDDFANERAFAERPAFVGTRVVNGMKSSRDVEKGDAPCGSGPSIMTGLIDAIIHRMADLIERIQDEVERLAQSVFDLRGGIQTRNRRLDVVLKRIGKAGDITARAEDSASSLNRLLLYFAQAAQDRVGRGVAGREQIAVHDPDEGPLLREEAGDGLADAGTGAGDEGGLVGEGEHGNQGRR